MKISTPFVFLIISFFISCAQTPNEKNCHLNVIEDNITIPFAEGEARHFMLSPFEKNKIFIEFKNSSNPVIELDLATKDTQSLKRSDWKKIYSSKTSIYHDKKDSLVWVGEQNRDLLRYDQKTKKEEYLPIKYVKRIVPYKSKTYFVANSGLYVKDKSTVEIRKITDLPIKTIQRSQLLDEKTLILYPNITYSFETDTWKEGIQLYQYTHEGKFYSFRAKDGIGLFEKDQNLFYSIDKVVNELNLNYNYQLGYGVEIRYPYIYGRRENIIDRYNVQKKVSTSFKYRLPRVNDNSPKFRYDGDIIWIHRAGQLYFINTVTNTHHNFPIKSNENFISMSIDDCHIYLLYEKRIEVRPKKEFIDQCLIFNLPDYLAEFQEFENFVDSIKIKKEQRESFVVQKLALIKERYKNVTHPDILKQIERLNTTSFQYVDYKTVPDFQNCYKNEKLPKKHRMRCFQRLIDKEVRDLNFSQIVKHKIDFISLFELNEIKYLSYILAEIDSIENYLTYNDSIGQVNMSKDSLHYYKAMSLNRIVELSFFCHQGCGGCDYYLHTKALQEFIAAYPNSHLVDNSELVLLDIKYSYDDGDPDYARERIKDLQSFKNKFPKSDLIVEADFKILQQLFYSEDKKHKIGLIEKFDNFIKSYPNDNRINEINKWRNTLKK